jgi:hypothetical protein
MTTSPPSERDMREFVRDAMPMQNRLIEEHKNGFHRGTRERGCPACLFRDATWPGLAEERMTP